MTSPVATIGPQGTVADAARMMLNHRISGLPVIDDDGRLVGMLSEGDLIHRAETHTEHRRGGWSALFAPNSQRAADYIKSHGRRVAEVMTREVISVGPMARLDEIADLFDERRVKRLPVVDDGKLVGIVTRGDLLRVLASSAGGGAVSDEAAAAHDRTIRGALIGELARQDWTRADPSDIVVTDRVVHLWGIVGSEEERKALRIAAENTPGVRAVEDHMTLRRIYPL